MSNSETKRITLNRESNEHTRRLKRSLNKVKWSHSLMQIFWTAGPVTTIGLIGGYYIGYGTMPSIQLLIYFVSFTVFSGLVGLVAKVVYDGTRGHLEERSSRDILDVTDKLSDLILVARDKVVQTYEGDARNREAALQLLRRIDLTPYGVNIAFSDLTGNREIGEIMGKIYTYRRIGLQTKVREIYSAYQDQIHEIAESLSKKSPAAARELKLWFTGNTSGRLKYGVPREKQFLQRIMSAIENNNPYLMTFRDVEEMMVLAFELTSGREIPTLTFGYSGKWKYAKALDELERNRSKLRVAQAKGSNRMRALSAYLIETGFAEPDDMPEGIGMNELIDKITKILDDISSRIFSSITSPFIENSDLESLTEIMATSVGLYTLAHEGYKETGKRHKEFKAASEKWHDVLENISDQSNDLKINKGRRGIQIKENIIVLDEVAKLDVCRHLSWYFRKEDINNKSYSLFSSFNKKGSMAARRLAIEIAVALEPHIHLSKPEIQRNINATKAIYLGGLSPDMSSVQKQELGWRMAREADNGLNIAAIRLAETLVWQYRADLSDESIDFLRINYNASRKALERIANKEKPNKLNFNYLNDFPPDVMEPKAKWIKSLQAAKKANPKLKTV